MSVFASVETELRFKKHLTHLLNAFDLNGDDLCTFLDGEPNESEIQKEVSNIESFVDSIDSVCEDLKQILTDKNHKGKLDEVQSFLDDIKTHCSNIEGELSCDKHNLQLSI